MVLGGNVPDKEATPGVKLSSLVTFSKRTVTCVSSPSSPHASTGRITPRREFLKSETDVVSRIVDYHASESVNLSGILDEVLSLCYDTGTTHLPVSHMAADPRSS